MLTNIESLPSIPNAHYPAARLCVFAFASCIVPGLALLMCGEFLKCFAGVSQWAANTTTVSKPSMSLFFCTGTPSIAGPKIFLYLLFISSPRRSVTSKHDFSNSSLCFGLRSLEYWFLMSLKRNSVRNGLTWKAQVLLSSFVKKKCS